MSARAPLCRRWFGEREPGCQVDSLPSLPLPGLSPRFGGRILSGLWEEAGTTVEPTGALDGDPPVCLHVVVALPGGVVTIALLRQPWPSTEIMSIPIL
jgi:hypothetical protein